MILDCPYLELIGDGFCFDESNNANCNFDGGDCCGYDVKTDYCSDCRCFFNETCVAGTHPLVGDGFCNDETNNALCDYDHGDCCGVTANIELCSNCTCWCKTFSILIVKIFDELTGLIDIKFCVWAILGQFLGFLLYTV